MIDDQRRLMLSLKPGYADAILDGTKTIELRRTRPRLILPTEALIYASSPTMAVVGRCRVIHIVDLTPEGLWRRHGKSAAIDRQAYLRYFHGSTRAYGLLIADPIRLESPIELEALRSWRSGFHPPQSFQFMTMQHSDELLALTA